MTRPARLPCARCGREPSAGDDQGDWYAVRDDDGALALACPDCGGGSTPGGSFRIGRTSEDHARVIVQHVSGWRLDWTEGARTADVSGPDGSPIDCVQVVAWDWAPAEGGPSRMAGPPPTDVDLAAALEAFIRDNADDLGLPGLD